jgi:uncharacterized protein YprB with RNaseH-like and TPR domain
LSPTRFYDKLIGCRTKYRTKTMSKLKNKLDFLDKGKSKIKERWETIDAKEGLSTREKLDKLVKLSLKREERIPRNNIAQVFDTERITEAFSVREFSYHLNIPYGNLTLSEWNRVTPEQLALIASENEFLNISPQKLLFFDTETTGLAGGTGTIPFMLGFGFFHEDTFKVKIFILNDLDKENELLDEVDEFLLSLAPSAVVTYNGKSFDYPLMEARYILQRKRFPLLRIPHLDFLYPARTLWKYTYPSRKLGHLGDLLLGISRDEDIESSQIPAIYFNYLRSRSYETIRKIVDHNALDLLGLSALLLLGIKYLEDITFTRDEGEILGTARLFEKNGDLDTADRLYQTVKQSAVREDVKDRAVKGLAILLKKKKLYTEAAELWELLSTSGSGDHLAMRELSVHLEHRVKDYNKALELVRSSLDTLELTDAQRMDFEKRYQRLTRKTAALEKEE